jgi:hypothetical protein
MATRAAVAQDYHILKVPQKALVIVMARSASDEAIQNVQGFWIASLRSQ